MKYFYLAFILLLTSCLSFKGLDSKENRKKRKAKRKIERAKELAPDLFSVEVVEVVDTIYVDHYDTIVKNRFIEHDSVIVINNERVKLVYVHDSIKKEIHHHIECKEVEKIVTIEVEKEQIRQLTWWESNSGRVNLLFIVILVAVIVIVLLKIFR